MILLHGPLREPSSAPNGGLTEGSVAHTEQLRLGGQAIHIQTDATEPACRQAGFVSAAQRASRRLATWGWEAEIPDWKFRVGD